MGDLDGRAGPDIVLVRGCAAGRNLADEVLLARDRVGVRPAASAGTAERVRRRGRRDRHRPRRGRRGHHHERDARPGSPRPRPGVHHRWLPGAERRTAPLPSVVHEPPLRRSPFETRWQRVWAEEGLYAAVDDPADPRPRFFALDMFPYPSGDLHMGHAEAFSGGDARRPLPLDARRQRAAPDRMGRLRSAGRERGDQARDPAGGVDLGEHRPAGGISFDRFGMSFDWSRRVQTCDPEYYRWTQWLFLRLFERGLAYRAESPVNWCPKDADGPRQRAGDRGRLRAVRDRGRASRADAVVLQDHRLRAAPARRRRPAGRLARPRRDDAAELDRALRGRRGHLHDRGDRRGDHDLHDAARHPVGRHVLRVRGGAPGGAAPGRAGRDVGPGAAVRRAGRAHVARRAGGGRHEGGRGARGPRREPRERGAGAVLRGALRPDGLRHRRDHGGAGARPAGLRVRATARSAGPRRDPARGGARARRRHDGRGLRGTRA